MVTYPHDRARSQDLRSLAIVSTYPPTRCGLASFSAALAGAVEAQQPRCPVGVVEVVDRSSRPRRREVVGQLTGGDERAITAAAAVLNMFDVVMLQHEYGIFPGPDGAAVLDLLDAVAPPVVTVLHTVLAHPTDRQREVLERVVARSSAVVVMTHTARDRLGANYGVDQSRVHVIPHGASLPLATRPRRPAARPTMVTWGLLGPGKGIEHAIDALALLDDVRPQPCYVVAGQTHPKVRGRSGDAYRELLMTRAADRGVADRVEFEDRYLSPAALAAVIRQSDVVVLPYESREQVTSGVLVDAVASGRPVVATEFPHAVELLRLGAGLTVAHDDPVALAGALRRVLREPGLADRLRAGARALARDLCWESVAGRYLALARQTVATRTPSVA
jgi:glycosyltransferase involved in cell wall biosynthesis